MEARLMFMVELDYQLEQYSVLINKAITHRYNPSLKKYEWVFYVSDLDLIISTLAKSISFEKSKEDIMKVAKLCPPIKEKMGMEEWKGKGEMTITEEAELFLVGEWQKDPTTGVPKQSWKTIPKQNVISLWKVIERYPIGEFVKVKTISEHLCRQMGFDRFFRDSGTFDWEKYWGTHSKGYLPFVYYPVKILAYLGMVEYSRKGKVCRLKDELTFILQSSYRQT